MSRETPCQRHVSVNSTIFILSFKWLHRMFGGRASHRSVIGNLRTPDLCGNQVGLRAAFDGKWCQENRSADSETRCVHSVYGFGRNFFLTPSDECGVMLFSAPGYREILATSLSTGSWDQAIEPEIRTSEFLNLCELSDSLPVCTSNVGHPCQMSKNTMGFEQSL